MHYVDGRQPSGRPRKKLCDTIRADRKSLNLSKKRLTKEQYGEELSSPKSRDNMQASYPILDVKRLVGR